ncbi:alkaline phosphatase D family protein [Chachezhania antarctica]|uniref:alkaline phosphatase D family protein n=1 Tax=Chachezhania antarctica TaxID=2340860 RepID=UPI000EADC7F6|nr:alkaline phosphatase D family protein [Chachezhania antarctica]|tara:strand:+ start:6995 stop:8419 length:1425 start_codon:yes stop_codon:yes gene_type:complete
MRTQIIGPILVLDDVRAREMRLSALFITERNVTPPPVEAGKATVTPEQIAVFDEASVWRARFSVPADRASEYVWNGETYAVAGDLAGDFRIAYVSCNGEEIGDLDRADSERNAMWERLREDHLRRPFALLLHGGDQVYADEATLGHELSEGWPDVLPRDPSRAALADLRHHLREKFFERYAMLYAAPQFAWIAARVPSLMQWDDHDICDGWGSLRRSSTYSPVGQTLFSAARDAFLIFQQATTDGDLPTRFADPSGTHLGWSIETEGLRIFAPDLRSERTRRNIMGPGGWAMMEAEAAREVRGRTLLLSSVPLLGPRLSLLEAGMIAVPRMQKYEDDLRDQWQSRAHRDEWRRMLRLVRDMVRRQHHDVTAISGEIHLATRAVMDLGGGLHLHQLVASGIAHRAPPKAWARFLGALSWLGEDPLPEHPIRTARLPGQPSRYVAERNYLVLERQDDTWLARWELEASGTTPALAL